MPIFIKELDFKKNFLFKANCKTIFFYKNSKIDNFLSKIDSRFMNQIV